MATLTLIGSIMYSYHTSTQSSKQLEQQIKSLHQTKEQKDAEFKKQLELQQQQIEKLKIDVQARATQKAQNASLVARVVNYIAPVAQASGDHSAWLTAAGIPQSQWSYVDYIVTRESGWNPSAVNKSSGACSLMQFLPCSVDKAGVNWSDPVNSLIRGNAYAIARYGSWANAVQFWSINHWW